MNNRYDEKRVSKIDRDHALRFRVASPEVGCSCFTCLFDCQQGVLWHSLPRGRWDAADEFCASELLLFPCTWAFQGILNLLQKGITSILPLICASSYKAIMPLWNHTSLTQKVYFIKKPTQAMPQRSSTWLEFPLRLLCRTTVSVQPWPWLSYRLSNKGARRDVATLSVWSQT